MKFPRIYHLPYSPGATSDDKRLKNDDSFHFENVIITEKMDGENTCLMRSEIHARSENSKDHPSRHLLKSFHGEISHLIPHHIALFGENLYAKHSIKYENLPSNGFLLFAAIDLEASKFVHWNDVEYWASIIGIKTVPVLYEGQYKNNFKPPEKSNYGLEIEGYVIRKYFDFKIESCRFNMAKWVRANHVQTDKHWSTNWVPNGRKPLDIE